MLRKHLGLTVAFSLLFLLVPIGLHAQSATTGTVQGVVKDPTGAVIPGATVTLTNKATSTTSSTTTDATGHYSFPAVAPGDYSVRITSTGFQSFVLAELKVDVTKSYNVPASLKIGTTSQTVTVAEVPGAELQTTNASIGTSIGGNTLLFLPTSQRNVTSLLTLQPAVIPETSNDVMGGQVAGAMSDQTTFLVDGGDATDDLAGTNGYAAVPGQPEPSPNIAVNVESTQEFRVVTGSPTSNFSRSQGGEVAIVSKRGTNHIHGSLYEYYTGSTLGANSWEFNRIGHPKPHRVNNRFGFTLGGPILKDRLWFFGNYEGRKFRQSASIGTDVPTATARQGILQFRDCAKGFDSQGNCLGGNVVSYNLANASLCGITSGGAPADMPCDPRGIGIDPVIQKYWSNEPLPNVPGTGDGLNSMQYLQSYSTPTDENYGLARLDLKINQKWHLYGTFRYQKLSYLTTQQFDITPGNQHIISGTPVQPRFVTFMLTGQIGSHFTAQTHGSYLRDWWGWNRATLANPSNISGLGGTLQVSGEGATGNSGSGKPWADPINFNTQGARARMWAAKDWYLAEDDSWLHGNHNISFGGAWYFWNITHLRTDDVLGGLTNGPIYWISSRHSSSGSYVHTLPSEAPPTCNGNASAGPVITTNCLQGSDVTRWDAMYSAMLGLVDHSSQVATRDGNFNAYPLGSPLIDNVHIGSFYSYMQDMWQVKPTITLTYGLSYGAQFPPREVNNKQAMQLFSANGQPVQNLNAYFQARQNALDTGIANQSLLNFNFVPIAHIPGYTRPTSTYWGQFGPRVAVAWQPAFNNKFFGNRQTVIRAGYSVLWNRTNAVGLVMTPLLGTGLAQLVGCNAPVRAAYEVNKQVCDTTSKTNAETAFRIGIDGNKLPMPTPTNGYPVTPASIFGSTYGFNLDPAYKPAWSHNVTADIQRSFPHNWLVDVGYIGRFSRNLENGADLNASDMFAKDPKTGETLAQAFDAVSTFIRGGGSCGSNAAGVTVCPGLATQPFFENMATQGASLPAPPSSAPSGFKYPAGTTWCGATYGSISSSGAFTPGTCTAVATAGDTTDALYGSLGSFMEFNYNFVSAQPLDPMQFVLNFWNYSGGWANYNAGFISVHKAFSQGLNLTFNYTWSHALGTQALNQEYIVYGNPSPFNQNTGYGTAAFDRRQVINTTWYYVLPFGQGQRFSFSSAILNRIVGGWYTSGIWTWQTGQPLCIAANGDYGDIGSGAVNQTCAQSTTPLWGLQGRHNSVAGSGGVGTNGDPTNGGSGINIFSNPGAVFSGLSRPLLTQNLRPFDFNMVAPVTWNVDLSIGKNIAVTERYKAYFTADFFNAFNIFQPNWGGLSLDMANPQAFGVVTGQANSPRSIQLGLRLEF